MRPRCGLSLVLLTKQRILQHAHSETADALAATTFVQRQVCKNPGGLNPTHQASLLQHAYIRYIFVSMTLRSHQFVGQSKGRKYCFQFKISVNAYF